MVKIENECSRKTFVVAAPFDNECLLLVNYSCKAFAVMKTVPSNVMLHTILQYYVARPVWSGLKLAGKRSQPG